jgi:hypothetical protein
MRRMRVLEGRGSRIDILDVRAMYLHMLIPIPLSRIRIGAASTQQRRRFGKYVCIKAEKVRADVFL